MPRQSSPRILFLGLIILLQSPMRHASKMLPTMLPTIDETMPLNNLIAPTTTSNPLISAAILNLLVKFGASRWHPSEDVALATLERDVALATLERTWRQHTDACAEHQAKKDASCHALDLAMGIIHGNQLFDELKTSPFDDDKSESLKSSVLDMAIENRDEDPWQNGLYSFALPGKPTS